jgi:hypothetical protein
MVTGRTWSNWLIELRLGCSSPQTLEGCYHDCRGSGSRGYILLSSITQHEDDLILYWCSIWIIWLRDLIKRSALL